MSRIISVPARYAPFVEQTLAAMQATIDADPLMLDSSLPWRGVTKDDTARGTLVISVASLPADTALKLFPQVEPPVQERIAS
jgi:hypothetical protein